MFFFFFFKEKAYFFNYITLQYVYNGATVWAGIGLEISLDAE